MLRRLVLCCLLLCAPIASFALTPERAKAIADGDSDERITALNEAVAAGEPGLAEFVQALLDDAVKVAGDKVYNDPNALQALQANALEKIQKVELDLRKRLDRTSDQLFLNGTQDVPPSAKALVDEYYKRIGKGGGK